MTRDYYLYMGQDRRENFALPEGWRPLHVVEAEEEAPASSVTEMTLKALSAPIGAYPLQDLASRARKIAIIVDDATRPTPVKEILSTLMSILETDGFLREDISLVVALGTHGPMKREELVARLGENVVSDYRIVQHDAWQENLVPIRIPDEERVVKINPAVAEADLRIGISSILPHPMAGYGGGPKIVMPGVCNFEFIRDHHMKNVSNPATRVGATKGNPFHEDLMKTVQAIRLDFSINCVYDQKGEIVSIIGGSLEQAFAAAVDLCFEKLGHKFEEKVDVSITSAFPHTHGHQIFKGLSTPDIVTKDHGAILLFAPVVGPMNPDFLNSFHSLKEKSRGSTEAYVRAALSKGEAFLPDKPIDFNMAMSTVFLRPKIRTILVSDFIKQEEAVTMGLEYASSIKEGLDRLEKAYPRATAAIFPVGGLIVPITAWQ